ncbi:MAG TPA: TMEM165/GDT1 family protein [Candidatus Omnitrophota bacterium]|nr:TMEM165/GDT1 family protein [Candidatus Omnitrophota bacterium]HPS19696.1 TMEM165/GDT1 family protein [Candidatus Omnitrophota bacterium]
MAAFLTSFIFVLLAEMGDKTQLLVMAFAARYSIGKVLLAVFLATVANHSLAVVTGHLLTKIIPLNIVSLLASLSFIIFGLWTLREEEAHTADKQENRFGPILTVGIAFFLAEMGDKTQLAAMSLAATYKNMFFVLAGTTLGMMVANAIGLAVGMLLHKHVPEKSIKWIAAIVFILFGLFGIFEYIRTTFFI